MTDNKSLCINTEFKHLTDLINAFWVNSDLLNEQIKQAFNKGLDYGRFWVDDMLCYDLHEEITGKGGFLGQLREVKLNGHNVKYYDSLFIVSSWLDSYISEVHRYHINNLKWHTLRGQVVSSILSLIDDDTNLETVVPASMSKEQQKEIINSYKGYNGQPLRSYSTPEYLSPDIVNHHADYDNFVTQLLAQCFFHGVMCAERKNTLELKSLLAPIYADLRYSEFNADLGGIIINKLKESDLIKYMLEVFELKFYDKSNALEEIERREIEAKRRAQLTKEQLAEEEEKNRALMAQQTRSLIDELMNDDALDATDKSTFNKLIAAEKKIKALHPTEQVA